MTIVQGLITTRFRALLALVVTAWFFATCFHPMTWIKTLPWTWMFAGILPPWAVVIINVAFYGYIIWLGIVFAVDTIRKEEKTIWVAIAATVILTPVRLLVPSIKGPVQWVRAGLFFIAFLAAVALLVSFWDARTSKEPS
jgi:hypothetical protein